MKVIDKDKTISDKNYKPEIDGLRAIAIIAVIINHFNKDILQSGYLGVDIFFVISGFVITSSIERRKYENFRNFIFGFYERRVKRLFPAICLFVIIATVLSCIFISDPKTYLSTGRLSLIGLSNIALFENSIDYFATSADLNPFLHTWSLGVEEQFYFLFPFIAWFSGLNQNFINKGKRNFKFILLIISSLSLIGFLYFYERNFSAAYFLMPFRIWEIGFGSIIYFYKRRFFSTKLSVFLSDFLFLLIIGTFFLPINIGNYSTVLVVSFTCMYLCQEKTNSFSYNLLTSKNIIKIGKFSYSLYLWHWLIIVISRWTIGIHWWSIPFQVLIIFLCSYASFKLVENPLRNFKKASQKLTYFISGIMLIIVFNINNQISKTEILQNNLFKLNPLTKEILKEQLWNDSDVTCINITENIINKNCKNMQREKNLKNIFIIGDSHGEQASLMLEKIIPKNRYNYGFVYPEDWDTEKDLPKILWGFGGTENAYYLKKVIKNIEKDDLLVIAFHRGRYNTKGNVKSHIPLNKQLTLDKRGQRSVNTIFEIAQLVNSKKANLLLLKDTPLLQENVRKVSICDTWRKLNIDDCSISYNQDLHTRTYQDLVFDNVKQLSFKKGFKVFIWDPFDYFYRDKKEFSDLDSNGLRIMRDQDHLSRYGIDLVGKDLKQFLLDTKLIN